MGASAMRRLMQGWEGVVCSRRDVCGALLEVVGGRGLAARWWMLMPQAGFGGRSRDVFEEHAQSVSRMQRACRQTRAVI